MTALNDSIDCLHEFAAAQEVWLEQMKELFKSITPREAFLMGAIDVWISSFTKIYF